MEADQYARREDLHKARSRCASREEDGVFTAVIRLDAHAGTEGGEAEVRLDSERYHRALHQGFLDGDALRLSTCASVSGS